LQAVGRTGDQEPSGSNDQSTIRALDCRESRRKWFQFPRATQHFIHLIEMHFFENNHCAGMLY
jgi:hypothetical protein